MPDGISTTSVESTPWPEYARAPIDIQLEALRTAITRNDVVVDVLAKASVLNLPEWYLTGGGVFQTVWNVVTGRPATYGIRDLDLFYFDDADLSWEAEDEVIQRSRDLFGAVDIEIRNQARVHLWYGDKFGIDSIQHSCTESGIDSFVATTCCVGVRTVGAEWTVYAPHGFADMFNLVVRPNPVLPMKTVYETKVLRWQEAWRRESFWLPWAPKRLTHRRWHRD